MTDKNLPEKLRVLKTEGRDLIDCMRFNRNVSSDVKTQLIRTFTSLCKVHTEAVSVNEAYCRRPTPVWIDLRGPPGEGKNVLVK
jgi:predicted nucleotidyltransferase component of viral defense system